MLRTLQVVQILVAIVIVGLVLVQSKGGGFTSGVGNTIGFYRSRRGLEKAVFVLTIFLALFLVVNSLILFMLS